MAHSIRAQALSLSTIEDTSAVVATTPLDAFEEDAEEPEVLDAPVQAEPPKPVEHIVQPGESLSAIATKYQVTWKRLFDKNTVVASPDVIKVNERLMIPTAEEVLAARDVPAAAPAPAVTPRPARVSTAVAKPKAATYTAGSSAGNTYVRGYCTWYAKNRRPDLPNNLGNAITWVSRAAGQGLATGSAPRVGAIGQSGNHVVYVEAVNGNGTVTVSEMNYEGYGVISSRTAPASSFSYIY